MSKNRKNRLSKLQKQLRPAMVVLACLVVGGILWLYRDKPALTDSVLPGPSQKVEDRPRATGDKAGRSPNFDKDQYSVDDPTSLWAVVNKGRKLPADYVPASQGSPNVMKKSSGILLRFAAVSQLESLFAAAHKSNLRLVLVSGYRSYSTQSSLYAGYVARDGQAMADTYSARPGHSEHQTGLAADIGGSSRTCELEQCFGGTAEGKWLADNSYEYGFVIRYKKGQEKLTGYSYEPWHLRFVGVQLAAQIQKNGQTLEQFFGLPAFPIYTEDPYRLSANR
ncbi:MAG: M15 family metallopeptidase [Candidatus Saccharimonadales bacterium]